MIDGDPNKRTEWTLKDPITNISYGPSGVLIMKTVCPNPRDIFGGAMRWVREAP